LLQNNDTLQRLELRLPYFEATPFDADLARSLQPGLLSNQTLKHFDLGFCHIYDEDLGRIVDALVGNTTMESLNLRNRSIASRSRGLIVDRITRLLELTRLRKLYVDKDIVFDDGYNDDDNFDAPAVLRFKDVLRRHGFEELSDLDLSNLPEIRCLLARNVERHEVHGNEEIGCVSFTSRRR
jgi:hypothetical protein